MVEMTSKPPISQPNNWGYIIQTSIDEGLPGIALQTIDGMITPMHLPLVHHLQFLLYLLLEGTATDGPQPPLNILYRYLDIHRAGNLALLIPSVENKEWLSWPGSSHNFQNTYARRVKITMERCITRGVWGLVFPPLSRHLEEEAAKVEEWREEDENDQVDGGVRRSPPKGRKGKKRIVSGTTSRSRSTTADQGVRNSATRAARDAHKVDKDEDEEDEEEEEQEEGYQPVSSNGWLLLGFLVAMWEKDAVENEGKPVAFLSQLWRPSKDLAFDQADAPLEVIRQAVYENSGTEGFARRPLAASLLRLLINAASGESPSFHPTSLTAALLPLFRNPKVAIFISSLTGPAPSDNPTAGKPTALPLTYGPLTHFLTHAIEDAAGVRQKREQERQADRKKRKRTSTVYFTGDGLSPPTVEYAMSLLDLDAKNDNPNMYTLQLALVTALAANVPSQLWDTVNHPRFAPVIRVITKKDTQHEQQDQQDTLATECTLPLSGSSASHSVYLTPPSRRSTRPTRKSDNVQ